MDGIKLSKKDSVLIVVLALIVIGSLYYLAFYTPLQKELSSISLQSAEIDNQIAVTNSKISSMDSMQAELDEIFARPKDEITEIAPYDNAKSIMNFLHGILGDNYDMSAPDPLIDQDGTVRRKVNLSFTCADYASAKAILKALASWNYRCLLESISISGGDAGIAEGQISVSATMTFFESKNIA